MTYTPSKFPKNPQLSALNQGGPYTNAANTPPVITGGSYTIPVSGRWIIVFATEVWVTTGTLNWFATIAGSTGFNGQVTVGNASIAGGLMTALGSKWEGFISAGATVTPTRLVMDMYFIPTLANPQ